VSPESYELRPVGWVQSPLSDRADAPLPGTEGGPEAWLVFDESVATGISDLHPGAEILVLTWLHRASRDILRVHPRGNPHNAEEGVFSTRSPDRPNPIGLHRVTIVDVADGRIRVRDLEAIDGTPVLDVKPVLSLRER
jgi:tRNA-Thr(GGU) m(6)t(6)A37 methyltransferase TsaA